MVGMNINRAILIITLVSILLVVLLVMRIPQGLYEDPAEQMKALQQYLAGESPSFNHMVRPDPDDLSRNKAEWFSWWPPGTQIAAYPLLACGLAVGDALRIIAVVCLIIGSLGWIRWFLLFAIPRWIKIVLAIALPWMRYQSNALFMYSAEILVYAVAPWILLAAYGVVSGWKRQGRKMGWVISTAIFLGFAMGFTYILKYTAVFISLGVLVYMGLCAYRFPGIKNRQFFRRATVGLLLAVIFFVIPVVSMNLINYKFSGYANLLVLKAGLNLHWQNALFLLANPALAMADADAMWNYALLNPQHGLFKNYPCYTREDSSLWLGLIGFPAGLLLFWLILRIRSSNGPAVLARSVFFTSLLALFVIWTTSRSCSYQPRYLAAASMAVIPVAIQNGLYLYRSSRRGIRIILAVAAIAYLLIPLLYGGVSVIAKVLRTPKNYALGPARIYNPILASVNLVAVRDKLMRRFQASTDIWYIPEAVSALDIGGRAIITYADFADIEELKRVKYFTSLPLCVHALLLPSFEASGKGSIIRQSFIQAAEWERQEIEGCRYVVWTAKLKQ